MAAAGDLDAEAIALAFGATVRALRLQAGISLATIATWCGTSIQMISKTYGKMVLRYEGASPVSLDEQFQTAKAEAMSLLADTSPAASKSGAVATATPSPGQNGPPAARNGVSMPRPGRHRAPA